MNVRSIYETLAALGTGAVIAGCGTAQTPINTAEQPPVETASTSSENKDEPAATEPQVAGSEQKPSNSAEPSIRQTSAPAETQPVTTTTSPAMTTANPVTTADKTDKSAAAKAKPVVAKAKPVKKAPTKTAAKKAAEIDCGEGGCT